MILKENTIDISGVIESLTDRERIEWVRELVSSINDAGTIGKIREIINSPGYDD